MTSFGAMPNYFSHFGLIEPPNISNTPLAFYENKLGTNIFDIIHATPERQASFMTAMTGFSAGSPPLGTYDLSWVLQHTGADSDPERALVVDAGGGKGQALLAMFEAVPDLPRSRCVLEDLPEVLDAAKKEGVNPALEGVQLVPFDLHAGQPVKGASPTFILPSPDTWLTPPEAHWFTTCGTSCTTTPTARSSPSCATSEAPWRPTAGC